MTMWIVRFISYNGGAPVDGYFRDEMRAQETVMKAAKAKDAFTFTDDFGIEISLNPSKCVRILTNTDSSAALGKAISEANTEAARTHGVVPGSGAPGSSVH